MIVSKRRFNLDVNKIKIPLLGSSKVFKRQFEAASFKRCASIIKTIFFSEFIDFWLRKVLILRIWAILIISDPLFIVFSRSKLPELFVARRESGSIIKKSGWLLFVIIFFYWRFIYRKYLFIWILFSNKIFYFLCVFSTNRTAMTLYCNW